MSSLVANRFNDGASVGQGLSQRFRGINLPRVEEFTCEITLNLASDLLQFAMLAQHRIEMAVDLASSMESGP
jgi:hypothetical protein